MSALLVIQPIKPLCDPFVPMPGQEFHQRASAQGASAQPALMGKRLGLAKDIIRYGYGRFHDGMV